MAESAQDPSFHLDGRGADNVGADNQGSDNAGSDPIGMAEMNAVPSPQPAPRYPRPSPSPTPGAPSPPPAPPFGTPNSLPMDYKGGPIMNGDTQVCSLL